tara:strand:+ start:408 stop:872 length:465 start_codon:yes stop_codon:yes gene_type:complete
MHVIVMPLKRVKISEMFDKVPVVKTRPANPPTSNPSPAPISPNTTKNQTKKDKPKEEAVSESIGILSRPCCRNKTLIGTRSKKVARGAGNFGIENILASVCVFDYRQQRSAKRVTIPPQLSNLEQNLWILISPLGADVFKIHKENWQAKDTSHS